MSTLQQALQKNLEIDSEQEEKLEKINTTISPHFFEWSQLLPHPFIVVGTLFVLLLLL